MNESYIRLLQCFPKWWSADRCRSASPQLPVRKVSQETGQMVSESRNGYFIVKSHNEIDQGSPKYGPRATSGPLRPLIWPAELSLKKQTKLGKLKILTPLYSDMHIAKLHVAVCKALCLICNDTIAVLKEYNIQRHYESKHSSHYSQFTGQMRTEKCFLRRFGPCSFRKSAMWPPAGKLWRPLA